MNNTFISRATAEDSREAAGGIRQATGRGMHSIMVDDNTFTTLKPATRTSTRFVDPDSVDVTLNPAGRAVDAGVVLPGVTEALAGKAPDLGAYEQGQQIPHYGLRPK